MTVRYSLDPETSSFIIEDYNHAPAFSSFFPGIAGLWGIPMWVYYVSRGQGIISAGVRDKNGQILEFQSFNQAVMRVEREGFRTFLRFDGRPSYEPFRRVDDKDVTQRMIVRPSELVLVEKHAGLGFEIEVSFFTLPGMPVGGLVRDVRVRNLENRQRRLEWVDGAPRVLPFGLDFNRIKGIPRHIEGMMGMGSVGGVPVFRLKQTPDDSEQIGQIDGGHFYVSGKAKLGQQIVVDPEGIFGDPMDLDRPWQFDQGGVAAVGKHPCQRENRTPSAFTMRKQEIGPKGEARMLSVLGYVRSDAQLATWLPKLRSAAFLDEKRAENLRTTAAIADHAFTVSSQPYFDAYAKQSFLDNVVRGGLPQVFDTKRGRSAFYVYSRQNGDLERDYHFFVLEPSYLSQGTGHYRSVLQNRRTDSWFFPEVEDANLDIFLGMIQTDGYNPLEVCTLSYRVEEADALDRWLRATVKDKILRESLRPWMLSAFTPGELIMRLEEGGVLAHDASEESKLETLKGALKLAVENEIGGLHEGFWVDHWHYNLDTLDIFEGIHPEKLERVLFERREQSFFDDPDVVLPRSQRLVRLPDGRVRNYGAVARDAKKESKLGKRDQDRYRVRAGRKVYRTTAFVKLLCIAVNRLATLDAAGRGVEMEAGKPGWNDSMNGLPGLIGSGLSEALELRKALRLLLRVLNERPAEGIAIYQELADFIAELSPVLATRLKSRKKNAAFSYWDAANTIKESYREATKMGVSGREARVAPQALATLLAQGAELLDRAFDESEGHGARSPGGVPYTYFINTVTKHELSGEQSPLGHPTVRAKAFEQTPVRLFLEGAVHWMKERPEDAAEIYKAVKRSPLWDRKLKMYKSCVDMRGENPELGRAVGAYPRGWIENESVYLHMEYKYLLEILRSGLCDAFWRDAKTTLIPFMDPAVYGRSTLEGASFIVSSAYADQRLHGRAFQPRLSGITCELLHIWILAVAGQQPFRLDADEQLELRLEPRLPGWLFTTEACSRHYHDPELGWFDVKVAEDCFAFKLMGHTLVVYRNRERKPTWGARGVRPTHHVLHYRNGTIAQLSGEQIPAPHAAAVRSGEVARIDVELS